MSEDALTELVSRNSMIGTDRNLVKVRSRGMDGIHDLGGKQGYGPIEVDDDETPFHHDWEAREWGMAQSARTPVLPSTGGAIAAN